MQIDQRLTTNVLVIGAGGAGLRAALAAAEAGSQVIIVNKGPVARSGITLTAAGGMQAPLHPDDSPENYFYDTVCCGYELGDQNLIRVLAEEAAPRVADLERYGVKFVCDAEGGLSLRHSPGSAKPRNLSIKGGGIGLVASLVAACKRNERITIIEDFFVTGLIKGDSQEGKAVAGALGVNLKNGELTLIKAKAVVMASGGCQQLWAVTDCPTDATGDGIVYSYRLGAELVDLEMVLFYPSIIVWPPSLQGAFVHYEFLSHDMLDGNIYDKDGIAVLPKPLPIRDQAMRLIANAISDGRGGPHGGLLWYVGDSPKGQEYLRKKLDILQYNYLRAHGVEPATDKIEVAPGAHYLMGGIFINEKCQTTVQGLFAATECAGNFDGANRLAGSGITATQVFGYKAGISAHNWAALAEQAEADKESLEEEIGRVGDRFTTQRSEGADVNVLRDKLRAAVQQYAGVCRNAEGLAKLKVIADEIRQELALKKVPQLAKFNQQLVDVLQLDNMCEMAGLVAGCAELRTESRGHHYRIDFPEQDDVNWRKHTLVVNKAGVPDFTTKPVVLIN